MLRHAKHLITYILDQLKNKVSAPLNMAVNLTNNPEISEINRYLDDQDRRHYQDTDGTDVYSVTTVLENLEEGENEGLKWWKKHNDGEGDNADWRHLLEYKRNRGTLAHHAAMADHYEAINDGEQLWSDDETSSLYEVMDRVGDDRFLYSILADKEWVSTQDGYEILMDNEDITLDDVLAEDLDYFTSEYDRIAEERGINSDTLEAVEEMFVVPPNHEHNGYGGQIDLVYRDPMTGGIVVADLKTSSAVRDKHKYQAAAYATALEKTEKIGDERVERAEIIRIHPDSEESEVYSFSDFDQYWSEFAETTKEM